MALISLFFFFFNIEFQPMSSTFDDCALYHQTKTSINFWFRWELNPRTLIQPSDILPVKLTKTHGTEKS